MRIGAGATLVKNGSVLLGLRNKQRELYPDTWDIFGGHCEEGESSEETLIRELKEEIGITPIRYEKLGVISEPNPRKYGDAHYHVFVVYEWIGELENLGGEHQRIQWFKFNELHSINLALIKYIDLFSQFACSN
jgi:8-oxo-dGTP diphosphatase